MKKLMVMLVAAVAVVSAQAASVKWTCTGVKMDGAAVSGTAYFVDAATLSQATLATFTKASDFTTALSGMYSWTPEKAGSYNKTASNAELGLADAITGHSAYLLIFDTDEITDTSRYYTTTVKDFSALAGTETVSLAWAGQSGRISSVGWTSVSGGVPEPTSGLLMLIGMAGLALRRKRA